MISGHLRERGGYFYMELSYYDEWGVRHRFSKATGLPVKGNRKRAEQMLAEAKKEKEWEVSNPGDDTPEKEALFCDFLKEWLSIVKQSVEKTTYDGYNYVVNKRIIPFFESNFPGLKLVDLKPMQIQRFYTYLLEVRKVSPNTVIHCHANLHKALNYAYKTGLIDVNPSDRVEKPKLEDPVRPAPYSNGEIRRLLKMVQGTSMEYPVVMGAFYGLRRGEAVGLKWESIDFFGKTIRITNTVTEAKVEGKQTVIHKAKPKTRSSRRTLPLVEPVEDMLLRMKEEQRRNKKLCGNCYHREDEEYIYVNSIGELFKPGYITKEFPAFLRRNGLRQIRYHDLRHPYVKRKTKKFANPFGTGAERFSQHPVLSLVAA